MNRRSGSFTRRDSYGSRINRTQSPALAYGLPVLSIFIGTLIPVFFIASAYPLFPPLGFLMLLGWRIVRPGMLPIWAGFPLGMFDDLFSGQPFGSAMMLWSITMITIDIIDIRLPWRSFYQDWLIVSLVTGAYLILMLLVSGGNIGIPGLIALIPQFILSVLLFPILSRIIARLDRLRLMRISRI